MSLALRSKKPNRLMGSHLPSPVAGSGGTATIDAWQRALATFEKSLPAKHLQRIQIPTTPGDVVAQVAEWDQRHRKTRSFKVATTFQGCIRNFERFSAAIDQLAQGSPQPACLLWGCIRFVLTVSSVCLSPSLSLLPFSISCFRKR